VIFSAGVALDVVDLPRFGASRVFTEWGMDPALFVGTIWVAGLYLLGVWTLRSRGDRWPVGRTVAFVVGGCGSFYFATQSGLAAYDTTLLSAHMVQHMILSMVVPLFLALGAPVTLALRTLPGPRVPGEASPRGLLTAVLHSRVVAVLAFPLVAFALFVTTGIDPAPPRPHTAQVVRRLSLPTIPILLLVAFTIGPNMLEDSLRNWSIIYMRDTFAAPSWVDTLTLPVFLLAQSIGRLNADGFVTKYGPVRVARTLNISAFTGCLLVTLAPNLYVALAGFMLIGIGVCASYPLTTSAAARLGDRPSSQNVASLTLAVQVIMLVSPAALGWIATNVSIRATFGVILPAILLSQWLARNLKPRN